MVLTPALGRLARGDRVEVWSDSAKAWLEGCVEQVFERPGTLDGYSVPAGCIKVSSAVGIKYVMPGQAHKLLRPRPSSAAASSSSGARTPRRNSLGAGWPRPTVRQSAGPKRLEARDHWNAYEIRLQELFAEYDRDRSGQLETEEFRELLRDFNEGVEASEEEYGFMMRLCDKDNDGKINLGELHYALRAWHSYRHLDGTVLRLFAAFDTDASGRLDPGELQGLLTAMNGGILVPMEEVLCVIDEAGGSGAGAVSRPELLVAIACWYARVGRRGSDIFALLQEAALRTAREANQQEAFSGGLRGLGNTASVANGYAPVLGRDAATAVELGNAAASEMQEGGEGDSVPSRAAPSRANKAVAQCFRSWNSLCYAGTPFLLGWAMAFGGWHHRVNQCPRNLDGILLWFGLLVLLFSSLNYVRVEDALVERAQLAVGVMLAALSMIGILWTLDVDVEENQDLCGQALVWWSKLTWLVVPSCGCGYGCYALAWHTRRLRIKDSRLQHEIVL